MSDLTRQLREARRNYAGVRYPGDLAADVLGRDSLPLVYGTAAPRNGWKRWAAVGLSGAIAASAALVFLLHRQALVPTATVEQVAFRAIQPSDPDAVSVVPVLAGETIVPADVEIVPVAQNIEIPAIPSFPSLSDISNSETSTDTQENL